MLQMDLGARLKNKAWWIGLISIVILIGKYFGFDLTKYIGSDWQTLIGLIFGFLAMLGVTVDTSTTGISDQVAIQTTAQTNDSDKIGENTTSSDSSNQVVADNTTTDNQNSTSTEDIEALKAQIASLTQNNNDLANANSALNSQLSSVQSQLSSVQAAINANVNAGVTA
jgi:phi LC3 family holin